MNKVDKTEVISITQAYSGPAALGIDMKFRSEMAIRTDVLKRIDLEKAKELSSLTGGKLVDLKLDSATEWAIVMEPERNFKVYFILQRYSPEFEDEIRVMFGAELVEKDIPISDAYDWTRLCSNALVRAAKRILGEES